MQPGFHGPDRNARKLFNFREFVALGVVQQNDDTVFITELGQGLVKLIYALEALVIEYRVFSAWQTLKAIPGKLPFVNRVQAPARKAPPLVDEQVVHDAAQP